MKSRVLVPVLIAVLSATTAAAIAPTAHHERVTLDSSPSVSTPQTSNSPVGTDPSPASGAHPVECFDLPISSLVIDLDSCWQVGPTALLLGGTDPTAPGSGLVAVIQGQSQSLTEIPGSGPLKVVEAQGDAGCVEDSTGGFHTVSLIDGSVGLPAQASCPTGTAVPSNQGSPPGTAAVVASATVTASTYAAASSPPSTPSYYEYSAYISECSDGTLSTCPLYQQGASTYAPPQGGLVVLDFGSQCSVPGSSPVVYGVEMFPGSSTCTPGSTVRGLAQFWIDGYESDHSGGTGLITLGIGTSSSYNGVDSSHQPQSLSASGQAWYQQTVSESNYTIGSAPIAIWGASDIEESSGDEWWDGADSVSWVQGYSTAADTSGTCFGGSGFLADYGDYNESFVEGGSQPAGDNWSDLDVYDVAGGISATCALPEIYYNPNATEWENLNHWAAAQQPARPALNFVAAMSDVSAGSANCPAPTDGSTELWPTCSWQALQTDTNQSPIVPGVTQISTSLQGQPPQVYSVNPSDGPAGGGSTVTITGSNFLGTSNVDFGSTSATSFTVTSSNTITTTSPAGSAGLTAVTVETALGTSTTGASDDCVYNGSGPLSTSPTATVSYPGQVNSLYQGTGNTLCYAWYTGSWNGPINLGASNLDGPPTAAGESNGVIDAFWKGTDSALYHEWYYAGTWYGPVDMGGTLGGNPQVVDSGSGRVDVFWVGTDGYLWGDLYTPTSGWGGAAQLESTSTISGSPHAVAQSDGTIDIFWKGSDGSLWHQWYYASQWYGPQSMDVQLGSQPVPVNPDGSIIDVYWQGTDGTLWHMWWNGTWYAPTSVAMGTIGSMPDPVVTSPGVIDVYWQGTDGRLWHGWYNNGWYGPAAVASGVLGSPPSVVGQSNGAITAVWQGTDNNLWSMWWSGNWEGPADLSQ